MKKMLTPILFLFFAMQTFAQNYDGPYYGFRLGLTAHPTFGFIKAESGNNNGTNLGFSYGLMADFNFAPHYSFNTGLTVTTINGKSREINALPYHAIFSSTAPVVYDIKYKMQYIEVPLVLKLKTDKIGLLKWYGQFGLSNDFKINAHQDARRERVSVANNEDSSEWTRFYRAGLIIGGGAEYDLSEHTSLTAGLSLNNGLTNISSFDQTVRNHFVSINIGVFF